MSKELEDFYGSVKEMCNTEGYKALCQDFRDQMAVLNSVENTKDEADLFYRKGQLNILNLFLNMEENIKIAEEQLEAETANAENL